MVKRSQAASPCPAHLRVSAGRRSRQSPLSLVNQQSAVGAAWAHWKLETGGTHWDDALWCQCRRCISTSQLDFYFWNAYVTCARVFSRRQEKIADFMKTLISPPSPVAS
eukprot:scaffold232_cov140-Isochrysis_galbana.AAC.2